jgi:hypothetical protein
MSELIEDLRQLGEVLELDMPIISTKADKTVKAAADEIERLQVIVNELAKAHASGGFIELDADLAEQLATEAAEERAK